MRLNFSDVKSYINYNNATENNKGYAFPMLPRLNNVIGNIQQEQTHVISGLPSSGVSSFIDQNYVISTLLQWYNTDPDDRQPLKIFYYSMKDSEMKKLQLLLCNYIKLVNNLVINIATLNNQVGKLYNLSQDDNIKNAIEEASDFFDEVLDEEVLVIKDGQYKPTDIYNDLTQYVDEIGSIDSSGKFQYEEEFEDQITLVIIDSVDHFLPDNEGFGIITGNALDEKFQRNVKSLKNLYKFSFVLTVPSIPGYIRSPKDTEPHFRHLGSYGSLADKGICLYNPVNENNIKFYEDKAFYISDKGSVLLRTWHVVRNTSGVESVFDRILFLPGMSYMLECSSKDAHIQDIEDTLDLLKDKSFFYDK